MSIKVERFHLSQIYHIKVFLRELDVTFWLQVALLATAAASVEAAAWVEYSSLVLVAFLAALTATLLLNIDRRSSRNHILGVLTGGLFAYLGGLSLTEADQWRLKFSELHTRLGDWGSAVIGDDATTDTLPLSVTIIIATWFIAYLTSWCLFKYQNVWLTLIPVGTVTILNLTYLPIAFAFQIYLFVFLFLSLIMIVHITSLKQRTLLRNFGISHPASIHHFSLMHGLWLSAIIIAITIILPIGKPAPAPLQWILAPVDRAVAPMKEELYRIFSAVPSHNPSSVRFFGSVLPLVRPIPIADDPILFSDADYPLYWPAIAYENYTSKAWQLEDTESKPMVSLIEQLEVEEEAVITGVEYKVSMYVDSPYLLVAGIPVDLTLDAKQEFPGSRVSQLDLVDQAHNSDLPLGLQKLALDLSASTDKPGSLEVTKIPSGLLVSKVIKQISPSDGTTSIDVEIGSSSYYDDLRIAFDSQGTMVGIEVVHPPLADSPVLLKPVKRLGKGDVYNVTSEFMLSSEEALRKVEPEYPVGIQQRYLQIPNSLPERVSVLASQIVSGAPTTYDKAVAVETYLRTFEYTVSAQNIPHDADIVDYFLFESMAGFSDYFSSAMAMMLRTQGIPVRLVLGFGPGKADPDEKGFLVRDLDSHSWPEVYFPEIGWVPFEPTPIYDTRIRGRPESSFFGEGFLVLTNQTDETGLSSGLLDPNGETRLIDNIGGPLSGGLGSLASPVRHFGTPLGLGGAVFIILLLVGYMLMRILWMRQYGGLRSGQTVYERVRRLTTFLGFPSHHSQTVFEFSQILSILIPSAKADLDFVSDSFVREKYGGIVSTAGEDLRLTYAWSRIKRMLTTHLRRTKEYDVNAGGYSNG